ncbi:MAG: hypothetical protein KF845_11400 [Cyclobacteriaceae bacterium]|nr:hypothetical protein [Cyclobacteriaceae bacterium]
MILVNKNIVVIGKAKILGKRKSLTATIFEFENEGASKSGYVKIKKIQEVGENLEIKFSDERYPDEITLVIKEPNSSLKGKILKMAIP